MSDTAPIELMNEARKLVEQLGGKKTKSIDELKGELDRMIAESNKPGYSPEHAEILMRKRQLLMDTMETARELLATTMPEKSGVETPEKKASNRLTSAFAPERKTALLSKDMQIPSIEKLSESFRHRMSSLGSQTMNVMNTFLAWSGEKLGGVMTYLTSLWKSVFVKKSAPLAIDNSRSARTVSTDPESRPTNTSDGKSAPTTSTEKKEATTNPAPSPAAPEIAPSAAKKLAEELPVAITFNQFKDGTDMFGMRVQVKPPNVISVGNKKWKVVSRNIPVTIDSIEWVNGSLTISASAPQKFRFALKLAGIATEGTKTLDAKETKELLNYLKTSTEPLSIKQPVPGKTEEEILLLKLLP